MLPRLLNFAYIAPVIALSCVFITLASLLSRSVSAAAPNDIIINEIMYNPSSDDDNDEFLELYNKTNSAIDISGWCFSSGITLCFDPGTSIPAFGHAVVSRSSTQTQATYGVNTIGTYTGKLSNGGETVTLEDENQQVINSITYNDSSPWPASPDGTGPSLELNNPNLDNSLFASWSASQATGGTPGAPNSNLDINPPQISEVNKPENISDSVAPTIKAQVTNATSVELAYKVMFEPEQPVCMQ